MNARTNYMLVGFFVLFSAAMVIFFVTWLLRPADEKRTQRYRINFTESVSGLNVDSPVKYRGVTIGKVEKIRIHPDNIEMIEVQIQVDDEAPIKTDTVAKLRPQGITGLIFVDLSRGSKETPRLTPENGMDRPLIKSEPSFFVRVERSFGSASENLSSALIRIKTLLNTENRQEISRILNHTANLLEKLDRGFKPEQIAHVDTLVQDTDTLIRELNRSVPRLRRLLDDADTLAVRSTTAVATMEQSFAQVDETMRVFNERNLNNDYSIQTHISPPLKQFEMTMIELQQSLMLFNALLRRYEQSPSDILFEYSTPKYGPGERP